MLVFFSGKFTTEIAQSGPKFNELRHDLFMEDRSNVISVIIAQRDQAQGLGADAADLDRWWRTIIRQTWPDRPDLAEKVIAGELSANAAAIKAGFRIKSITIPIHPERAARSICNHFSPEQIGKLIVLLTDEKVKEYSK